MIFDIFKIEPDGRYIRIDCGSRFKVNSIMERVEQWQEKTCSIEKKKRKRSNDANAYFWTLCGQLSAKLRIPKEELYRQMIKDIGDNSFIEPVKNSIKDKVQKAWRDKGIGWITEELGESRIKGYTNVEFYFGSSSYDTAQMSRLIDIVVEECKEQGIDTLSEKERSLLLEKWNEQTN